jgi:hypothetical protein
MFTNGSVSAKQVERLCHHYGESLESLPPEVALAKDEDSLHYAMADGSYLLTRQDGWKETKVGRLFKGKDNFSESDSRQMIHQSSYCAHLGGHHEFIAKFEALIGNRSNLVFIADGAKWIWNWIEDHYPQSVQILDFYHGYEKICEWIVKAFTDRQEQEQWCEYARTLLLDDQIEELIEQISQVDCQKQVCKLQKTLLVYLCNNQNRMKYATFLRQGYLIGSGAIESAQRTVVQHRLKRSGQRWTPEGAQQILNLRTAYLANQWGKVENNIRKNAA